MTNAGMRRQSLASRLMCALGVGLCLFLCADPLPAVVPQQIRAIWVYPNLTQPNNNPVLNPAAGQQLIANAQAGKVNTLYLSVYNSTPNSNQRYLYDESLIANFIAAANAGGMSVSAAYGEKTWPALGCGVLGSPSFPIARIQI